MNLKRWKKWKWSKWSYPKRGGLISLLFFSLLNILSLITALTCQGTACQNINIWSVLSGTGAIVFIIGDIILGASSKTSTVILIVFAAIILKPLYYALGASLGLLYEKLAVQKNTRKNR